MTPREALEKAAEIAHTYRGVGDAAAPIEEAILALRDALPEDTEKVREEVIAAYFGIKRDETRPDMWSWQFHSVRYDTLREAVVARLAALPQPSGK